MLLLRFRGGLGNQLFQYATLRSVAFRIGTDYCYADLPYRLSSRIRIAATRWLKREPRRPFAIEQYFELDGSTPDQNLRKYLRYRLRHGIFGDIFNESMIRLEPDMRDMTRFSPEVFEVTDGSELCGFFQSPRYFENLREQVCRWFTPKPEISNEVDRIVVRIGRAVDKLACMHVRRGDYDSMRNYGYAGGWCLPESFYHDAISRLPPDSKLVVISDDPQWCLEKFHRYSPYIVENSSNAAVDLILLSRCAYRIISNSSFSWWGAWLGSQSGTVIAPEYFIGWNCGRWLPEGIQMQGWTYLRVNSE